MAVRSDALPRGEVENEDLEQYRRELTGYCYRMLGSMFEADDAVQDTMVKAWKSIDGFEGRSSIRSWLYRIATNVCLDILRGRHRRALAMDLGPSGTADSFTAATRPEDAWVTPIPDGRVLPRWRDQRPTGNLDAVADQHHGGDDDPSLWHSDMTAAGPRTHRPFRPAAPPS